MKTREEKVRELYQKIHQEFQIFQYKTLSRSREEIFSSAYFIDVTINLYEFLVANLDEWEVEKINALLKFQNILGELYEEWLKQEDSYLEELTNSVLHSIEKRESRCKNNE